MQALSFMFHDLHQPFISTLTSSWGRPIDSSNSRLILVDSLWNTYLVSAYSQWWLSTFQHFLSRLGEGFTNSALLWEAFSISTYFGPRGSGLFFFYGDEEPLSALEQLGSQLVDCFVLAIVLAWCMTNIDVPAVHRLVVDASSGDKKFSGVLDRLSSMLPAGQWKRINPTLKLLSVRTGIA